MYHSQLVVFCCLSAAGPQQRRFFYVALHVALKTDGCMAIAVVVASLWFIALRRSSFFHLCFFILNMPQASTVYTNLSHRFAVGQSHEEEARLWGCSRDIMQNSEFSRVLHAQKQGAFHVPNLVDAAFEWPSFPLHLVQRNMQSRAIVCMLLSLWLSYSMYVSLEDIVVFLHMSRLVYMYMLQVLNQL